MGRASVLWLILAAAREGGTWVGTRLLHAKGRMTWRRSLYMCMRSGFANVLQEGVSSLVVVDFLLCHEGAFS